MTYNEYFVCKKCKGMFFNIDSVQWIKWGNYYLCHDCLDSEIYQCNACGKIIKFKQTRRDAVIPYCRLCPQNICACCDRVLDQKENFPEDFPDNFKFCCGCFRMLSDIAYNRITIMIPLKERKDIIKLKEICCGTIGVWENKNVILE